MTKLEERGRRSPASSSFFLLFLVILLVLLPYDNIISAYHQRPLKQGTSSLPRGLQQSPGKTQLQALSAWRMGTIREDWGQAQEEIVPPLAHWPLALVDEITIEVVEAVLGLGLGRDPGASPTEWLVRKALQRDGAELENTGRALVAKRCLGVTSLRGRLEYMTDQALARAGPGWDMLSARVKARLLLGLYVLQYENGVGREGEVRKGLLGGDPKLWKVLSSIGPADDIIWPEEPAPALSARGSLPLWIAREWIQQYGEKEAEALAEEANRPGPVTLRWNFPLCTNGADLLIHAEIEGGPVTLRWNPQLCPNGTDLLIHLAIEGVMAKQCEWSPMGICLKGGRPPHGLWGIGAWKEGWFEVQDEGSQLVALASGAQPGETVLDLCAGQGGKALAMGAMMEGQGRIWCYDVDPTRLRHVEAGARRAKLQEVVRVLFTPADLQGLTSNSSSSSTIIEGEGKGEGRLPTAYMNSRSQSKSSSSRTTMMEGGEERRPTEDGREGRILTCTSKIKRGSSSPRPISTTTITPTTSTIGGKERGDGSSARPITTTLTTSTTSTIEGKERGEGSSARPISTTPTPSTTSTIEGKERGEERIPTTITTNGCDVVIVDAPCSSTGVLRRRPSLRWTLDPNQALTHLPNLQKALLVQAQAHVRVGGRLIYATCSALAQENEEVARWFIGEFGDRFRPLGWEEGGGESEERLLKAAEKCRERGLGIDDQAGWLRLLPHIHGTDGFFIARWIRER